MSEDTHGPAICKDVFPLIRTFNTGATRGNDGFIITYTGKKVYPLAMRAEDICFQDIAHALSNKCRFTGHTSKFYSIAEHSIMVSRYNRTYPEIWGLLHDAAEAYLPDLCTPIKSQFPILKEAEQLILAQMKIRFELPDLTNDQIQDMKQIDLYARWWESKRLIPYHPDSELCNQEFPSFEMPVWCWPPTTAKEEFIKIGREFLFNYL